MCLVLFSFQSLLFSASTSPLQQSNSWGNWLGAGSAAVASVSAVFTITKYRAKHKHYKQLKAESDAYLKEFQTDLNLFIHRFQAEISGYKDQAKAYRKKGEECQRVVEQNSRTEASKYLDTLMKNKDISIAPTNVITVGDELCQRGKSHNPIEQLDLVAKMMFECESRRRKELELERQCSELTNNITNNATSSIVQVDLALQANDLAKRFSCKTLDEDLWKRLWTFGGKQEQYESKIKKGIIISGTAASIALLSFALKKE